MDQKPNPENPVRFGVFEVDLTSGELRKSGVRLRLSGQPFQVLAVLLRKPGKIVNREELKQELWPADTFVDFENGVNTAIRKIRQVLDDSADTPRYVETLPRRGYRFIAQVEGGSHGGHPEGQGAQGLAVSPAPSTAPAARDQQYLPWFLFGLTGVMLIVLSLLYFGQTPPEFPLRKFAIIPPIALPSIGPPHMVAISPDGKHIAFNDGTAKGKLWVQGLEGLEPQTLEHTDGAMGPFWSPDSRFIGFATSSELQKVDVQGGQVFRLCGLPATGDTRYAGGSWSPDGETIAFGSGGVIYEVPALGGATKPLIKPDTHVLSTEGLWGLVGSPHFLPSEAGRRLLVFAFGAYSPRLNLMIQDLGSGRREPLGPGAMPFYSPTGHLVYKPYINSRDLMALPFSLETLKATAEAFPIARDAHDPSIAADGTLVYLERPAVEQKQLVWLDRRGDKIGEIGPVQRNIRDLDLSPDGRRVAVAVSLAGTGLDVWVYDLTRGAGSPVTTEVENDFNPAWSPSGEHLMFSSNRLGNADIFLRSADGAGEEAALVALPRYEILSDWSWDGKYLLFSSGDAPTSFDVWYVEQNGDGSGWGEPRPFLQTPFDELSAKLSPDGRHVAYVSDLSGEIEVYVESFPQGGGRARISKDGGTQPRWRRDGRELFYVEGDMLMAVSMTTAPSLSAASATPLFSHPTLDDHTPYPQYDVSHDGERFILAEPVGELPVPKIRVVQNWFAEFRGRQ